MKSFHLRALTVCGTLQKIVVIFQAIFANLNISMIYSNLLRSYSDSLYVRET